MTIQQSRIYNLALDEDERKELLQVLEECVTETRDESATPIQPSTVKWSRATNHASKPCWRKFVG